MAILNTCENCRFSAFDDIEFRRECRRQPPQFITTTAEVRACWPIVGDDKWCGEWAPVPNPEAGPH